MEITVQHILKGSDDYPERLLQLHTPPKQLFHSGADLNRLLDRKAVAVVGSRNLTVYGRRMTMELAGRLAEQGVVIISGLALGLDALAHEACLEANGLTIAVLPGPLETIYPSTHTRLAQRILEQGGALVSEYPAGTFAGAKQNFIARNRIIAGLSDAVLVPEAAEKSGSLHTVSFARQVNRDVLAVPGNVTSPTSVGANNFLKEGAGVVTDYKDVLHALKLEPHQSVQLAVRGRNQYEQRVLDLLVQGIYDGDELQFKSKLSVQEFNQVLTMLQIGGKIRALGANQWALH